jgi:uncharacterized protein
MPELENDKSTSDKAATGKQFAENRKPSLIMEIMYDAGLICFPRCFKDYRFYIAILAGAFILWLIHDLLPPFTHEIEFHWRLWISLVIWQPVIEEILFRGIVQGQLRKTTWGQRAWLKVSAANVVTSIVFVFMHMINNPPLFSISVIVPSLLFGYFRDRCNSVYPSILLHSAFNAFVIEALFIHGNMVQL